MIGLLLIKHIYNLCDETIVDRWIEIRIGKEGVEKLLKVSVQLFGKEAQEKEVLIDSTVQEKNITYPTDAKLHKHIIDKVNKIANLFNKIYGYQYSKSSVSNITSNTLPYRNEVCIF